MGKPNALIGLSGGPHAVIHNSMRGAVTKLMDSIEVGRVFAQRYGVLGALREELLDVTAQKPNEIALLEVTPSAGVPGSCRYKLPKVDEATLLEKVAGVDIGSVSISSLDAKVQDYVRLLQVCKAHNIGYFFYAGGNDSMDTAYKLNKVAEALNFPLQCIGVPKTIDNDVGDEDRKIVDHTPGYGCTATFWRDVIQSANMENFASCTSDPVLALQVMGRKVGYLPAAARLADPKREMPLVLILTEMLENEIKIPNDANETRIREIQEKNIGIAQRNYKFIEGQVAKRLKEHGRAIVVMSEGTYLGELGFAQDSFGHAGYSTGMPVAAKLAMYLNGKDGLLKKMGVPGNARADIPGTIQRHAIAIPSTQDLLEAFASGAYAAKLALNGESGYMATILRSGNGNRYKPIYDKATLIDVATHDRKFPGSWVDKGNADVSDEFVRYAVGLVRPGTIVNDTFSSVGKWRQALESARSRSENCVILPFIGGLRRFAQFDYSKMADQKLRNYTPVKLRA